MWRISPISEDWVVKGCHIHINQVELAVRPDQFNKVVFRKVFSSTTDADYDVASLVALGLLADSAFRHKLRDSIERAMAHMMGITGFNMRQARGRLGEFKFLLLALDRLEKS
jgi:hypothetical protein